MKEADLPLRETEMKGQIFCRKQIKHATRALAVLTVAAQADTDVSASELKCG